MYQRPDTSISVDHISMFKKEILKVISRYSIEALSEENSLEAQNEHGLKHSLPYDIAESQQLTHQYCDPTRAERLELGIQQENDIRASHILDDADEDTIQSEIKASNQLRERFWLKQIEQLGMWPNLLICGDNHVVSVANQANVYSMESTVLHEDWHA